MNVTPIQTLILKMTYSSITFILFGVLFHLMEKWGKMNKYLFCCIFMNKLSKKVYKEIMLIKYL